MAVRDHQAITIEQFNGLWRRGLPDSTPPDHFPSCNNVSYIESGFRSRDGINPWLAKANIVRNYTFTKQTGESELILDSGGNIYDSDYPNNVLLSITTMKDFGFVAFDGRAYISPCDGNVGLASTSVYVYKGDGTAAWIAGGAAPTGTLSAALSGAAGHTEAGIHCFAAAFETDTGFLTALGPTPFPQVTADGAHKITITIPTTTNTHVTKVHLYATQLILPSLFTGNTSGYQFFAIPNGVVNVGTTTLDVDFYDSELSEDGSYLLDIQASIDAGAGLGLYHNRLICWATNKNPSVVYISNTGEPESVDSVSGLIIFPLDGNPITNAQEYRDVLYVFKRTKTNSWSDNGDVAASWPMSIIDNGTGCTLHGIGKVLDSEGVNIDYLIVGGITGIFVFDGSYVLPELSWKIFDLWKLTTKNANFPTRLQLLNDSVNKILYIVMPDGTMMIGDYSNGLDQMKIRWAPWSFTIDVRSIAILNPARLIIASDGQVTGRLIG